MTNPSLSAHSGAPAVARLAWIVDDLDMLMHVRMPLLRAAVLRRHKVLVLAPGLTPSQQLTLLAAGIESAALARAGARFQLFSGRGLRHRIGQQLAEWRATAVVIDAVLLADDACRAAADAKVAVIQAVLPPLDELDAIPRAWAQAVAAATGVLVATTDNARALAAAGVPQPRVLSPLMVDLGAIVPAPLPSLGDGLIFLGVSAAPAPMFAAAVNLLEDRAPRARFRLAEIEGLSRVPPAVRHAPASRLETFTVDVRDPSTLQDAIRASHIVVVDGAASTHVMALSTAYGLGRPVLAGDTALSRDLVDAGADGWRVPAGADAAAWADAVAAILRRPDLLPGMARAAGLKAGRRLSQDSAAATLFAALGLADLRAKAA